MPACLACLLLTDVSLWLYIQRTAVVRRGDQGFGIKFKANAQGVIVAGVEPTACSTHACNLLYHGSNVALVAATGILQNGDILLSMNGESMVGKTLDDVQHLARQASRLLVLDVATLRTDSTCMSLLNVLSNSQAAVYSRGSRALEQRQQQTCQHHYYQRYCQE